jgi:replicative DNA helicase
MAERKLPQNLDAEMSVLGCAFLTPQAYDKVCEELTSDMFLSESNRRIFNAIFDLHENKVPLDSATVKNEIEKKGSINDIGGIEYLTDVIDSVINAANINHYIDIVRDKALRRKLIEVTNNICSDAYNEEEETSEIIDDAEARIFSVTKARKVGEFKSVGEVIRATQEHLERLAKQGSDITGVPSGYYELDKITSGFHENELVIIAARPSVGKTAFALNLAVNAAQNTKKAIAIFSMEMGAEQLAIRMISSVGRVEMQKLTTGRLEHRDWKKVNEAMSILGNTNLYFEDASGMTTSEIRAKCRRLAAKDEGLGLVIIDYLQLIQPSTKYAGKREQEVSDISRSLKTMAMELKVPVIALAQMSREIEKKMPGKKPLLSDLRESGAIEQDADIVAFLHRPNDNTSNEIEVLEFIVRKNRHGRIGEFEILFEKNIVSFKNYVKKVEE